MNKAYTLTVTPVATAERSKTKTGTDMIKFRATTTLRGREVSRTVIAQGKAFEAIKGMVRKGRALTVRAMIEYAPAKEGEKRGGDFLAIVGLPTAKAATAA